MGTVFACTEMIDSGAVSAGPVIDAGPKRRDRRAQHRLARLARVMLGQGGEPAGGPHVPGVERQPPEVVGELPTQQREPDVGGCGGPPVECGFDLPPTTDDQWCGNRMGDGRVGGRDFVQVGFELVEGEPVRFRCGNAVEHVGSDVGCRNERTHLQYLPPVRRCLPSFPPRVGRMVAPRPPLLPCPFAQGTQFPARVQGHVQRVCQVLGRHVPAGLGLGEVGTLEAELGSKTLLAVPGGMP